MNSLVLEITPRVMAVVWTDYGLRVTLTDSRWLLVPMAWFPTSCTC